MTKYNIEGNIDFFSELYKSFDNEEKNDENINLCLITDEPLIDKFINAGEQVATISSLRKMEPAGDKLTNAHSGKSLTKLRESSDPRI